MSPSKGVLGEVGRIMRNAGILLQGPRIKASKTLRPYITCRSLLFQLIPAVGGSMGIKDSKRGTLSSSVLFLSNTITALVILKTTYKMA